MPQKILVTGCNGLLGQKVAQLLSQNYETLGTDLHTEPFPEKAAFKYIRSDITDRDALQRLMADERPDFIVNTAAYTNVDRAEIERDLCWHVNVHGVENLIQAASEIDARLIQISTDYVFDGISGPYAEDALPDAKGFYAQSKLAAENAILGSTLNFAIIRTMILYGMGSKLRPNFVDWLIAKLSNREPVTIVDDQIGNPTLADDLAAAIQRVIERNATGIYHIAGSELIDRYRFAVQVAEVFDLDKSLIKRIKTSDLKQMAPRPLNSGFIMDKAATELGIRMRGVVEALTEYKKQLNAVKNLHGSD